MYFEVWFGFVITGSWTLFFFLIVAILFAIKK